MLSLSDLSKTRELEGDQLKEAIEWVVSQGGLVTIRSKSRRYRGEALEFNGTTLEVRNHLDRDQVIGHLKDQDLRIGLSLESYHFEAATRLQGLGYVKPFPTLKIGIPKSFNKREKRKSYRLCEFHEKTDVTFSTADYQLGRGTLLDVSMSGCAIQPDAKSLVDLDRLKTNPRVFLDIQIGDALQFKVQAVVVHANPRKLGCHFSKLADHKKHSLYQFIVQARRKIMLNDRNITAPTKKVSSPGSNKPVCLVVGGNEDSNGFLKSALHRKFEVGEVAFGVQTVRDALEAKPAIVIFGIQSGDLEHMRLVKKVAQIAQQSSLILYFGEKLDSEFKNLFLGKNISPDVLIEIDDRRKLDTYKRIESLYSKLVTS